MNIKRYKPYFSFIITIALFLVLIIYTAILYLNWDNKVEKDTYEIEVSLPIIDWQRYSSLSKQLKDSTMK